MRWLRTTPLALPVVPLGGEGGERECVGSGAHRTVGLSAAPLALQMVQLGGEGVERERVGSGARRTVGLSAAPLGAAPWSWGSLGWEGWRLRGDAWDTAGCLPRLLCQYLSEVPELEDAAAAAHLIPQWQCWQASLGSEWQ